MTHDLQTDLLLKMKRLDETILSLHSLGTDAARKEKEYRMTYAKTLLSLKSEGMAVSLIEGVAKGREEVAQAKLEWDIAVSLFDSCRESALAIKKEMDIMNDIIKREWGGPN